MAVANYPFYSTSYGETFGYNEREGNNLRHFRNRYLNESFRGSADLGPTRFSLARTAPANELAATQAATANNTQAQTARQTRSAAGFAATAALTSAPRSARADRSGYIGAPISRDFGAYRPAVEALSFSADPITSRPYYIPPPEVAPSAPFTGSYEFGATTGATAFVPTRHREGVAQSIPSNRLTAALPTSKTYRLQPVEVRPEPGYTSAEGRRPATPSYHKPTFTTEKIDSMGNYGKLSISRRLPEKERLRYHVPGYMGFVRQQQFRHGDTFGQTTRKCLTDFPGGI